MCKVRDIILVKNYKSQGKEINKHSFVVLSDEHGKIHGLNYDIICSVMSSFKNDEQRKKKLEYPGNFPIAHNDSIIENNDGIDGYIKAEQFYYFNKDKLDYIVMGELKEDVFNLVLDFIEDEMDCPIEQITDNL
ncbi:type II toxin-antitoxin system PemK/MazF family toxin [Clostridium autoethanogenum]|uniref:type II toxin-antitoxin system PemK/MazF family toxin n=1 Tax=Clostridium autoethanogenum TaxID=84023 RepID=UPI0003BB1A5C|nr:type II toxin-antitoxin system PemK/MazF family toxin [Clostridium autoethanogenum]ALU38137.1 PemK family protein [Clostridium autoethanogenum DSM 10061]OVY50901.1 PemK-like protein [Clostridium autoethanogenum]